MLEALEKYSSPSDSFTPPSPDSALSSLPPVLQGNWNADPGAGVHDILYWVKKDNPRSGRPLNPASDPQFYYWEYPVQQWALAGGVVPQGPGAPGALPNGGTGIQITSPQGGSTVPFGVPVTFASVTTDGVPLTTVTYYVNGAVVGTTIPPFTMSYQPIQPGQMTLRAVATRGDGSDAEQTITFIVQ
jgi:hypothetical protein